VVEAVQVVALRVARLHQLKKKEEKFI
jgi:hypothetical protein